MSEATPISPPGPPTPSDPAANATFAHKTSTAATTTTPFIDTSTPAINAAPVELDGASISPDQMSRKAGTKESQSTDLPPSSGRERSGSVVVSPGLDEEGEIEREFLGEGNVEESAHVKQKRAAMLATRSKDPGVIVDVSNPNPTAEEVEAAKSADGASTPAIPATGEP
ncbi:unnamed protein product [Periconia digitata]|uniref:Uncharacterized protein n=1 Tax=Periconia digitata TaxID=1303443 RepID=A0A9W4U9J2_9PLEO|nr:unnamed protein product [Periconia digitata]